VRRKGPSSIVQSSTASFVAPFVEESCKGLGLVVPLDSILRSWFHEVDGGASTGAIYGGVIGLGFTLTEDVLYVGSAAVQGGAAAFTALYLVRTVGRGPEPRFLHCNDWPRRGCGYRDNQPIAQDSGADRGLDGRSRLTISCTISWSLFCTMGAWAWS